LTAVRPPAPAKQLAGMPHRLAVPCPQSLADVGT